MIDLKTAQELGGAAFKQGICAPCLDKSLTQHLSPAPGENVGILKAWHRGWTIELLKEPVDPEINP